MKKLLKTSIAILIVSLTLSSCETTLPIAATSNPIGRKTGTAKATYILYFPPFVGMGNTSIVAAAKQGGITKISTVDFTNTWYVLFGIRTVTVTGE